MLVLESVNDMETKICAICKKELPVESFNKCSGRKDGLHAYCKECLKEYKRNRRAGKPKAAKRRKLYAMYHGDTCDCVGTCKQLADWQGVDESTIRWHATPSGAARNEDGLIVIPIDEDDEIN